MKYECTACHKERPRDELTVVRVQFVEMGKGGKVWASRVTAWLCNTCLTYHPQYGSPKAYKDGSNVHAAKKRPGTGKSTPSFTTLTLSVLAHRPGEVLAVRPRRRELDDGVPQARQALHLRRPDAVDGFGTGRAGELLHRSNPTGSPEVRAPRQGGSGQ